MVWYENYNKFYRSSNFLPSSAESQGKRKEGKLQTDQEQEHFQRDGHVEYCQASEEILNKIKWIHA